MCSVWPSTSVEAGKSLARLTAAGHAVRAVSRRTVPAFDWGDRSTWPAALSGATHVYVTYVPDLAADRAPDAITALTACAQQAGVQRLVLLSGRGESGAQRCEQIVAGSGLQYTIVRASWFAQNFNEGHLLDSVRNGMIAMPAGEVAEPFVDVEDIADVAFAALTEDRHVGQTYEVTGPSSLTFAQAAAEISAAAGRTVQYVPGPRATSPTSAARRRRRGDDHRIGGPSTKDGPPPGRRARRIGSSSR